MRVIFQVNYTYFHPINCIQIYRNQNPDELVQEGVRRNQDKVSYSFGLFITDYSVSKPAACFY